MPNGYVPYFQSAPSASSLKSNGLRTWTNQNNYLLFSGSSVENMYCGVVPDSGGKRLYYVADSVGIAYQVYDVSNNVGNLTIDSLDGTTGLYYGSFETADNRYTIYVPEYESLRSFLDSYPHSYPINYTLANCTVSAPSTASPGSDVVIQITPSSGYIFRGSSGVDIRDSDGIRVPFIVNGNQVAFTMPQP